MKIINCKVCGSEFTPKSSAEKICSNTCRETQKQAAKDKWRHKERKKWASYTKAWRARNPYKAKVSLLKARCVKEGLPFDLDEEWFAKNTPTVCPVLGIDLDQGWRDSVASVDKVIPSLGYIKENCRIISLKANRLKNNASVEDLEKIIAYIKNSS